MILILTRSRRIRELVGLNITRGLPHIDWGFMMGISWGGRIAARCLCQALGVGKLVCQPERIMNVIALPFLF